MAYAEICLGRGLRAEMHNTISVANHGSKTTFKITFNSMVGLSTF